MTIFAAISEKLKRAQDIELGFFGAISDLATPNELYSAPVEDAPIIQVTNEERSETVELAPVIGVAANGVPVDVVTPVLVSSPQVVAMESTADVPVESGVMFPTAQAGYIKTGADLMTEISTVNYEPSNFSPVVAERSSLSNVDLGLMAMGGLAIAVTGAVAIFRKN